jgi:hypothetical protein
MIEPALGFSLTNVSAIHAKPLGQLWLLTARAVAIASADTISRSSFHAIKKSLPSDRQLHRGAKPKVLPELAAQSMLAINCFHRHRPHESIPDT